jgi:hypothetical protein
MIYRVLRPLTTGQQAGDVIDGGRLRAEAIEKLLEIGALEVVTAPPLAELPHWEVRAQKLKAAGVLTITDLLDTQDQELAEAVKHKTTRVVKRWKREAREWLTAPNKETGCRRC